MIVKTSVKVKVCVKRFSPQKFVLHQVLRPGYSPSLDSLIHWTMIEFRKSYSKAKKIVCDTISFIDYYNLTYLDRDKLNLPNISERYPHTDTSYWNGAVSDTD